MDYKRLKDGTYVVGFRMDGRFISYCSAFDAREAKALVKAIRSILDLFHATSGAWVTLTPDGKEIPRGATKKMRKRERKLQSRTRSPRSNAAR
jgi:hypothetical protein